MEELERALAGLNEGTPAEAIQNEVYEIGKRHDFSNLRDWFKALYEVLLGQTQGPRFGSFVALYGVANTRRLITESLFEVDSRMLGAVALVDEHLRSGRIRMVL